MADVLRVLAQIGDQLDDLARERLGLGRAIERLAKPVGGDQLHRPGDLADVLDRLAAFDDRAGLGHGSYRRVLGCARSPSAGSASVGEASPLGCHLKYLLLNSAMALVRSDLDLAGHLLLAFELGAEVGLALLDEGQERRSPSAKRRRGARRPRCPWVPAKMLMTWSMTFIGLYCGCLSNSTMR